MDCAIDELRRLVDHAHGLGLAVIVDVVLHHGAPEGNALWEYDGWGPDWNGGIYHENAPDTEWCVCLEMLLWAFECDPAIFLFINTASTGCGAGVVRATSMLIALKFADLFMQIRRYALAVDPYSLPQRALTLQPLLSLAQIAIFSHSALAVTHRLEMLLFA